MWCDRQDEFTEAIKNHDKRITKLEISDARVNEKIESLLTKLDSLTSWIKSLVMLTATSLVGFFIWYIQNMGGR